MLVPRLRHLTKLAQEREPESDEDGEGQGAVGDSRSSDGVHMPPIKHQQRGGSPEIISADIHIPDEADLGTGTFITRFKVGALPPSSAISSLMIHAPTFQVSVTVNPNRDIPALVGTADGSDPKDRVVYLLPARLDPTVAHTIEIQFAKWHIFLALLDGMPLAPKNPAPAH